MPLRKLHAQSPLARNVRLYDGDQPLDKCFEYDLDEGWADCFVTDENGCILFSADHQTLQTKRIHSRKLRAVYFDGKLKTEEHS